ncbi:MAG: O-antigen ligase family protein [Caldilineales bacterium]|nr:O-antigen ligase family protein [Caldilineales bacterium]
MNRLSGKPLSQSSLILLVAFAGLAAGLLPAALFASPSAAIVVVGGVAGLAFLIWGWPFSAVLTLIVAAMFTRFRFELGPVSVRPEHIAAVMVAAVGGLQLILSHGRLRMPLAAWLALLWWGFNLTSAAFFSPAPAVAIQNALRVGVGVITFILMLNLIPDRRWWWWAIIAFLTVGIAEAAFGIVARALYPAINLGVQVSWNFTEPIPYGTFEEGNLFGSHTASWALVLLLLIITIGVSRRTLKKQAWLIAGLAVLLLALFLSLSRAAWLMFAIGVGIAWAIYRPNRWVQTNRTLLLVAAAPFTILLVLGVAPFLPAQLPFVDRLQSFLNLASDATFSARLSDWSLAWNDWLQQPLTGWGPGSFYSLHGELRARPAWIGNLSLRLLQETGIFGVLAFSGYLFALLLPVVKTARLPLQLLDRAALIGLAISYVVLLGLAYQSTDGIWLSASWVHAGLIAAGTRVLMAETIGSQS